MEVNMGNYSYDAIKYFIHVAEKGSLTRAAYSLGISQSALSQSMKNLEQSLGVKLFNRNTRGIILTREGKKLYEIANQGNQYFKNAIIATLRTNKSISLKTFKIATQRSLLNIFVLPIMKKMVSKYKDVNFEIVSYIKETDIVKEIQNENVDLVIHKTNGIFYTKEIACEKLAEYNYCFVYNPKFYNFENKISYNELTNYPIILKERTGMNDNSWTKTTLKQLIVCKSDDNILDFVKSGVGIGIYAKELAEKENLKIIELKNYQPTKRIIEAFYQESNEIAKDFIQEIKNELD